MEDIDGGLHPAVDGQSLDEDEDEVVVVVVAFKCAIRFFFFFFFFFFTNSSLCREPSPTRSLKWPGCNSVQITCKILSAHHVQHVVLRATWYKGTARLLRMTELKPHLF